MEKDYASMDAERDRKKSVSAQDGPINNAIYFERAGDHPVNATYKTLRLKSMMYHNESTKKPKKKESLYDYQKL